MLITKAKAFQTDRLLLLTRDSTQKIYNFRSYHFFSHSCHVFTACPGTLRCSRVLRDGFQGSRAWPVPALHPTSKSPTNGNAASVHKPEEITTRFHHLVLGLHYLFLSLPRIFDGSLVNSVHSKRSCRKQSKIAQRALGAIWCGSSPLPTARAWSATRENEVSSTAKHTTEFWFRAVGCLRGKKKEEIPVINLPLIYLQNSTVILQRGISSLFFWRISHNLLLYEIASASSLGSLMPKLTLFVHFIELQSSQSPIHYSSLLPDCVWGT